MGGLLKVGRTWLVGIGLIVAFQMFTQWRLDLEISLTPYEIGLCGVFLAAMFVWTWWPGDRTRPTPKSIAQDTTLSRYVAVPVALIGLGGLGADFSRDRQPVSALNDDPRPL